MKKRTSIIILLIIALMLSGCAQLIRSEAMTVDAVVVDTYYHSAWMQPIIVGKTTTFMYHPAKNCVVVEYEGTTLTINNRDVYTKYQNQIGAVIQCKLLTDYYDDGTYKQYLKFGD